MESTIKRRLKQGKNISDRSIICEFPKNMLLELTNICNDSCLMCPNSICTNKGGVINEDLAVSILEQAYKLGTREVGFYGRGESLLDRNLEKYISYAKNLGYEYVYITTNGALLDDERAKSIIEAGIDSIKFSINASNAKDYYLIHGKDEFDKVIENLINVDTLRKKQSNKVALYISYILTRYTNWDKENFKMKYQGYVDDIVFYECHNIVGCASEIKRYLSVEPNVEYHPKDGVCPMIFNNLYTTYEGYLTMCCADYQNYLVIADLNKESLQEAWNNQYAQNLRKRHLENDLEGTWCFNCINDCSETVEPLIPELAARYDKKSWSKEAEIKDRVNKWTLM